MAWGYKAAITVDHTKVSTADQTNFPVLISGTYAGAGGIPDLRSVANGGHVQSSSGFDIAFFSDSALTTQLSHEIESYTATSGAIIMWVNIPTLHNGSDDVIYIAYGDASISSNPSTTATWDSNFIGVWHLKETTGGSGAIKDSTSNANHGTDTNSPTLGTAVKIGNGIDVEADSEQYIDCGDIADILSTLTIEVWVKPESLTDERCIVGKDGTLQRAYQYEVRSNGVQALSINGAGGVGGNAAMSTGTLYSIASTFDDASNTLSYYLNGATDGGGSETSTIPSTSSSLNIGRRSYVGSPIPFDGLIDEVRISNVVRSAGWLATCYNTENSPSTFYSVGSESAISTGFKHAFAIII